jgi:hypothetical protein
MVRPHAIPAVAAAVLLLIALGQHPYGYYTFLRWAVTAAAVVVASVAWKSTMQWVTWPFVAIAILFNPIAPIYLTRQHWRPVDVICAVAFLATLKMEATGRPELPSGQASVD